MAEAAYRAALALDEADQDDGGIFKSHDDLSHLFSFLGQNERALEESLLALEAARRYQIRPVLGMALDTLTRCWLRMKNPTEALVCANEKVALFQPDEPKRMPYAMALVLRAHCLAECEQVASAHDDLQNAWPFLEPLTTARSLAGYQATLANWWAVTAQLRSLAADFDGAVAAWRTVVDYRRTFREQSPLARPYRESSLAVSLRSLGKALLAVEDVAGAEEAFQESRAIEEAIHNPSN